MKKYHIVYKTTNLLNGKFYIGVHSTNNLNDNYFGSGDALLKAIKKYGRKNFKREILECFNTREEAFKKEEVIVTEEFINRDDNYNTKVGGASSVENHTLSTKEKWSLQRKGVKRPRDVIEQIIKSRAGYKHSAETKEKIRKSNTGKKRREETIQKLIEYQNTPGITNNRFKLGHIVSDETRKKMSESAKARKGKYKHSDETKRKIRETTKLTKNNINHKYVPTEETKKKISESVKKTKQLNKQNKNNPQQNCC
jgi:hypothetical protein